MAIRRIVQLGEPLLRKKSKKVNKFDEGLKTLVDDMVETMHVSSGVGLAAPQVGALERVIVVQIPEEYEDEPEAGKLFALVNPTITSESEEVEPGEEGCLSIPSLIGEVERKLEIVVRAQNLKGKSVRIHANGYLARIFQHEIDHLDGVLFIDRVSGPDKLRRLVENGETEPVVLPAELPLPAEQS